MRLEQPSTALHLRGTVLPDGEVKDLWIRDGKITFEKVSGAVTLSTGGWILPGLVDAHCHIGLGPGGTVGEDDIEAQAHADLAVGVMLVRDCGSDADTRWVQGRADMPRLVRSGRHIARPKRYIRGLGLEIEPEQLIENVRTQAQAGDGWVKLVGDWIDRSVGDLAPLWPADIAAKAISVAHQEGARVTAHCFAEQSVQELVAAGIDCIEHGTGLDDVTIAEMALRGVHLVPTMINLENFPFYAEPAKEKYPTYYAHMHDLFRRRYETLGKAKEAGVPIHSGTDAGTVVKHGRIHDEIELLVTLGGPQFALEAASWGARSWLGAANIEQGASADLIVVESNPQQQPAVLRKPTHMLMRGRRVVL